MTQFPLVGIGRASLRVTAPQTYERDQLQLSNSSSISSLYTHARSLIHSLTQRNSHGDVEHVVVAVARRRRREKEQQQRKLTGWRGREGGTSSLAHGSTANLRARPPQTVNSNKSFAAYARAHSPTQRDSHGNVEHVVVAVTRRRRREEQQR